MQAFLTARAILRRAAPDRVDGQAPQRPPRGRVGELELAARRRLVLSYVAMIRTLNAQIKDLEREIRDPGPRSPRRPDLPLAVQIPQQRDHRRGAARRDRRLPRSATPTVTRSPPTPAKPRSLSSPGNGRPPGSDARATSAYASRSAAWPTQAATGTPGPKTSTPKPANAVISTPARSAPSDAPGAASCGNAGATTPPTTPPDTARCNATSPSPSPSTTGPVIDLAATLRMAGPGLWRPDLPTT